VHPPSAAHRGRAQPARRRGKRCGTMWRSLARGGAGRRAAAVGERAALVARALEPPRPTMTSATHRRRHRRLRCSTRRISGRVAYA